jgi:cellobiose-specific phosphotransferase system component IIA
MKLTSLVTLAGLALLSGCGADTAASAAAGAAIRKQEMEQAQKTIEQAKEKIDQAMQLERERAIAGQ